MGDTLFMLNIMSCDISFSLSPSLIGQHPCEKNLMCEDRAL